MEDLFEILTDDLLIHIISFLPTKDAFLTSVLSKRWKFLWCYAQKSILLDDSASLNIKDVGFNGLTVSARTMRFKNFVDTVLKLIKVPQVDTFFLKIYPTHEQGYEGHIDDVEPLQVHAWLDDIVNTRQAKEIQLHFCHHYLSYFSGPYFPIEIFNSASLRVLKLYFEEKDFLTANYFRPRLYLPNLKILHFWMDGIHKKWLLLKALFRASPRLEEAYFGGSLRSNKFFCNIFAPSLKRLRMIFRSPKSSTKFLIKAPILEELVVVDESFQEFVVKTMSNCPVSAKLDIGFPFIRKFLELHTHIHRVSKLLHRISQVKFLNLKAHTMDALSIFCNLPQFPALCQLKLCFLNYSSWDVIPKLLQSAPNLEVLDISKDFKGKDAQFTRDSVWIQPSSVPVCLMSTLRHVEVRDCESHQAEFNLINYLLEHGDALSSFLVELLPADSRDDLRFREKLMSIPRVSKACELKVSVYPHSSQQRASFQDEEKGRHPAKLEQQRMPLQEMCFEDLRASTDYFSDDRLIIRTKKFKIYRGKLHQPSSFDSPARDVVVKKMIIRAKSPYNKRKEKSMCRFREELKLLEHPNFKYHPYFVNMLGYCVEDNNERLGMVYDFKPLDSLDNLITKDSFKWLQRMKVALVLACISEYMHRKHDDLPSLNSRATPSSVILDEDYMPTLFNFKQRSQDFRDEDDYDDGFESLFYSTRSDYDVEKYGITLLGLISRRVHRCPIGRRHTRKCRKCCPKRQWAFMQQKDRYISSSLYKSRTPLVHKNLMDDSTYDNVDGLKITRLVMRCLDSDDRRPSMHAIVKYLCKLRVVRENWDVLNCDNIIGEHVNVLRS